MCLLFTALAFHPRYKLMVAANRDEYYSRPTAPAYFWDENPDLLAGKDLLGGGTWLGITRGGRIAAVTNYRDPASQKQVAPSRGKLVSDFLMGRDEPEDYCEVLGRTGSAYNGFNLVFGNADRLYWYSNRGDGPRLLAPGLYGLSNRLLDTPWPKVTRGKEAIKTLLTEGNGFDPENILTILRDSASAPDEALPVTGVGIERERMLSPIFIKSPDYGTRSSTLILVDIRNQVTFIERTYDAENPKTVEFTFRISD